MNKEILKRANDITKTISTLDDLNRIIYTPYPQFSSNDTKVNSASFDEETLKKLKETIKNFIETRKAELKEEFENL